MMTPQLLLLPRYPSGRPRLWMAERPVEIEDQIAGGQGDRVIQRALPIVANDGFQGCDFHPDRGDGYLRVVAVR